MHDPIHNGLDATLRAIGGEKGTLKKYWKELREKDEGSKKVPKAKADKKNRYYSQISPDFYKFTAFWGTAEPEHCARL